MTTVTQEISRKQFLTALFEVFLQKSNGYIETREIISGQKGANAKFHRSIEGIVNHNPSGDYYFGVCPRARQSGKEVDIEIIVSLWVDMDMDREAALKALDCFPLKPSVVVDSGHGVHAYWLLQSPEQVKANTKAILKGMASALNADHCYDLSRILRVPGTKNLKEPNNPKNVSVILFEPDRRYSLSDFDSYGVQIQENVVIQPPLNGVEQDTELNGLNLRKDIIQLIKNGKPEGEEFKSRSEADYKVVYALIKAYCSEEVIEAIFAKYAIGAKYRERGITYLKHTIDRARQNVMKSLQNKSKVVGGSFLDQHKIIYSGGNFYEYKDGCYRAVNIEIVKRWTMDLTSDKKTSEEIIYFLQAKAFVDAKDLNKTEYLNLKNGLLDFKTGELLDHDPKVYSTIQLDVKHNPNAGCERWIRTLKEIFPFEGEEDKISDLQEFFGLCFTRETKFGKALLCVGEGANGKSLILGIIAKLLGDDNISAIPLEKFDNAHYTVNLFGKLANIAIETNAKSDVYDSVFKAVVSGDPIQADQKYKPSFHFRPFSKLIIATNNLPRVDDKSDAYFRRLLIIRFNKQFTETEQNKNLSEELMQDAQRTNFFQLNHSGFFHSVQQLLPPRSEATI